MARRAKPHEEELPFVALMDTMTNVVGVLIIVLVMIGIGLAKSVEKVLSELPVVSIEEHDKLKAAMAEFDTKRDPAEVAAEIAKLEAELQKILEALKQLEAQQEKNPVVMVDLAQLLKQLEDVRKERVKRKLTIDQLLTEVDNLKKKLDTTPRYEPPPGIVVRLPSSKAMPDGAQLQRVIVTQNRLMFVRNEELFGIVEEQFKKEDPAFFVRKESMKGPDGKPLTKKGPSGLSVPVRKVYFDGPKMAAYFNKFFNQRKPRPRDVNSDMLVEVVQAPNSPNIQMRLTSKPEAGETIGEAAAQSSAFRSQLRAIKQDPKSVVWFHVGRDSIATYLAARDIVDREQIPVGWDISDKPTYTHNVPTDYLVEYTPPPPAATAAGAPPKPPGPPPVVIAAPKAAVD